jgi:hypothetical protein
MINDIEDLVDRYGIEEVLRMLAFVCSAKAEHLAANWRDESRGDTWQRIGRALGRVHNRFSCSEH